MLSYKIVPSIETGGYPLNPVRGEFSIIKPVSSTNYANDPDMSTFPDSIGSATPGDDGYYWTNLNGSSGKSITEQMFGVYSFKVIPSNSPYPGTSSVYQHFGTTSGVYANFSLYIKGTFGVNYTIKITTPSKVFKKDFKTSGDWMRVEIVGYVNSGDTYFSLETDTGSPTFYTDGWQIEYFSDTDTDKSATTFFTGTRTADDYTGGRLVNIQDVGFVITSHQGLSSSDISNTIIPFGLVDGSVYQTSRYKERVLSLNGKILSNTRLNFAKIRRELIDLLSPSRTGSSLRTQIRLVYQLRD